MQYPCPNSACNLFFPTLDICIVHLNDSNFSCGALLRSLEDIGLEFNDDDEDEDEDASNEEDEDAKYDGMKLFSI